MHHFLTFAATHWSLFLILLVLVVLLLWVESSGTVGGIRQLGCEQVVQLINREKALVIDVRTPELFANGHIVNALNLSVNQVEAALKKIQKYKSSPVILLGKAQDKQVPRVAKTLKRQGFQQVYSLRGGINAWQKNSYPLTKERDA